jgi:succinate dehydrogenase / fumarate reductase iron-sulfur subunit
MTQFFKQYHSIKPYLINESRPPERERLQTPEERDELNGLYECILCASCSTACPSFWWNPDKFVVRRACCRPIASSPTAATRPRTSDWTTSRTLPALPLPHIMNCIDVCPKSLNPTRAIGKIRS